MSSGSSAEKATTPFGRSDSSGAKANSSSSPDTVTFTVGTR